MNEKRLMKTLELCEANPDHHDQGVWHCKSMHCFAGFANILESGLSFKAFEKQQGHDTYQVRPSCFRVPGNDFAPTSREVAMKWLDLTEPEANYLFSPDFLDQAKKGEEDPYTDISLEILRERVLNVIAGGELVG